MKQNLLGNSNLKVSELALGCMSLGTDKNHAKKVIEAALEEGVTYFDTADLYEFGLNEEIVGEALQGVRDQVVIATKAGNRWSSSKDGWSWDPSKAHIKEAVKSSLKRLNTEYIDLYQLHGGTIEDPIDETIEAFEELKQEGFIRHYGLSSIRPNVIREYVNKSNIISVMVQYSILDRRAEEEVLPLLAKKGKSAVTRGTVAKGLLTDKPLKSSPSIIEKGYLDYTFEELEQLLTRLKRDLSPQDLLNAAVQYNLANPAVASIVAGASSISQVKENARAVNSKPLSAREIELIQSLSKANRYNQHR
ncbi:aldo/keto reductase [Mesobacillus harenae]|uniref:aldo/keto reductase n=1 Tax=Mesobacillus harenae TaxID=2213203 RepID=UPI0015806FD1|nr:aldo/keto reductase [Mesobacillus harenae]